MIHAERLTATLEGDFVVFLIGARINKPLQVHRWWPVARAMPRMLKELAGQPGLGLLHSEIWFGRTIILVQYWRSMEQLQAYAKSREHQHLPAWRAFNEAIGTDGSVGIWHETYPVESRRYECIYGNMPPFGLGGALPVVPTKGNYGTARERMRSHA